MTTVVEDLLWGRRLFPDEIEQAISATQQKTGKPRWHVIRDLLAAHSATFAKLLSGMRAAA